MAELKTKEDLDLFETFLKAVRIVVVHFWLFVLFFLGGAAVGAILFFTSPKVYESKMIVSSSILTDSYVKVMFENASKYLRQGNSDVLAEQFHISEATARQISTLEIENLSSVLSNSPKENDRFLITAEVYDTKILPELQKGLVTYLESNDFVKVRVEQNRSLYKEMLKSVEKEIQDMEELKRRISSGDFFQAAKGNMMFDPTTVNSKILELTERKIGYQNSLQLSSSVQVIDKFTKFKRHSNPKISVLMISGATTGLILAGLIIFYKVVRGLLWETKPAN
ncbi:MAG TPA: hypothetical protein VK589_01820 [Chryseolinea sp.]|nr:hypothetical protein [Chryseolinea sp.]